MLATTIQRLKTAVVLAAEQDDFAAAQELCALLSHSAVQHQQQAQLQLAPTQEPQAEIIHSANFWAQFTRNLFIPFLRQHGRTSFTSKEFLDWVQHSEENPLNTADLRVYAGGREAWKDRAAQGLGHLCGMGLLKKEYNSKVYYLAQPAQLPSAA